MLWSRVSLTFSSLARASLVSISGSLQKSLPNDFKYLSARYTSDSDLLATPSCSAVLSLMGGSTPGIKSVRLILCIFKHWVEIGFTWLKVGEGAGPVGRSFPVRLGVIRDPHSVNSFID